MNTNGHWLKWQYSTYLFHHTSPYKGINMYCLYKTIRLNTVQCMPVYLRGVFTSQYLCLEDVMNKTWRRIMWILGFHTWTSTSLNRSLPKLVSSKSVTTRKLQKRLRKCQARLVIVRILPNVKTTEVLLELGPNWLVGNILFFLYYIILYFIIVK